MTTNNTTATVYSLRHGADESYEVEIDNTETDRVIAVAARALSAEPTDDGDWRYVAPETGETYEISESNMLDAGASILHESGDWYSLWCSACGEFVRS